VEQRLLGRTGTFVSELCLGTMTFARESDEATSAKLLDRYLEAGSNFIDTADVYADTRSEEVLGRLLRGRRDEVVLATKGHFATGSGVNHRGSSRVHPTSAIEASLRRLQTDRIDLYQVHSWDAYTPVEETLATLDDLVHQGKARYLGISNFSGWQVAKAAGLQRHHGWAPFVTIQPQYSLITRDIEREVLPAALDAGLGVLPWGPLGGGFLSGKYHRDRPPPPTAASPPRPTRWRRPGPGGPPSATGRSSTPSSRWRSRPGTRCRRWRSTGCSPARGLRSAGGVAQQAERMWEHALACRPARRSGLSDLGGTIRW
jgi:aryl-alcohol dehydrogenase-like predicted oxidoreductase